MYEMAKKSVRKMASTEFSPFKTGDSAQSRVC